MTTPTRTTCPICGPDHGPADKTLMVWKEGNETRVYCHRGCDWREIRAALSDDWTPPPREPKPCSTAPRGDLLHYVWGRAHPLTGACLASRYLLGRGCRLPPADGDLRYLPSDRPDRHPCMVALVTDAVTAVPMTLHMTRLDPESAGKARVERPKMLLSGHPKQGGVIRLWSDEAVTHGLAVAEGIETALSAAHAFTPVWSCVDSGNLAALPVLPGVEALTIVQDGDPTGRKAARTCAERWSAAGAEVFMWDAHDGQDFNDVLGVAA